MGQFEKDIALEEATHIMDLDLKLLDYIANIILVINYILSASPQNACFRCATLASTSITKIILRLKHMETLKSINIVMI